MFHLYSPVFTVIVVPFGLSSGSPGRHTTPATYHRLLPSHHSAPAKDFATKTVPLSNILRGLLNFSISLFIFFLAKNENKAAQNTNSEPWMTCSQNRLWVSDTETWLVRQTRWKFRSVSDNTTSRLEFEEGMRGNPSTEWLFRLNLLQRVHVCQCISQHPHKSIRVGGWEREEGSAGFEECKERGAILQSQGQTNVTNFSLLCIILYDIISNSLLGKGMQ